MMKFRMMARVFALLAVLGVFEARASIQIKKNTDRKTVDAAVDSSHKSAEIFHFPNARKPLVGSLPRGAKIPKGYHTHLKEVQAKRMLPFYLEAVNLKLKALDHELELAAKVSGNFCAVNFLSDRLSDLMYKFYDTTVNQAVAIPLSRAHSHNPQLTWTLGLPAALFQKEVVEPIVALMDPDHAEIVRDLINDQFPEQYY